MIKLRINVLKMKAVIRLVCCCFLSIVIVISSVAPVHAQLEFPPGREEEWESQNYNFYNPDGKNKCDTSVAPTGDKITWIGDSLSEGALSEIKNKLPGVDVGDKEFNGETYKLVLYSKHFKNDTTNPGNVKNHSGLTIASKLKEQGELRKYLVFALGTNDSGRVNDALIDELIDIVGTGVKIVLVTNADDGTSESTLDFSGNNKAILEAANRYDNIKVADWEKAVSNNRSEYINDPTYHVHLTASGNQLFVKTINEALSSFGGGSSSGSVSGGDNKNYSGATVFSTVEMDRINANQPFYEAAANQYNFPWQLMAVFHSSEYSNIRANPANGQGAYQLYSYTNGGTNGHAFLPAGPISDEEFQRQSNIAASIIRDTIDSYHLDITKDDDVKELFFRYNGRAPQYINKARAMGFTEEQAYNGEGSAYVMNRYDARRDPTSSEMDPNWPGRFVRDGVYDPNSTTTGFGTFVKYIALGGGNGSGSCYGSGGGTIVETAILLSWGDRTHSKDDPKPEYVTAMKEVNAYTPPCNTVCAPIGASCDQFVATVIRYSGADPEFPLFGHGQRTYMQNSDKWVEINHGDDMSNLQPGDVLVTEAQYGYHILLFIGDIENDGRLWQASASFNGRTGEHFPGVSLTDSSRRHYLAFRRAN